MEMTTEEATNMLKRTHSEAMEGVDEEESDAETTIDDGDGPLSPCLWDGIEVFVEATQASPPKPSHTPELTLSPESQLNVLSQISQLAELRAKEAQQTATVVSQMQPRPPHVWASAQVSNRETNEKTKKQKLSTGLPKLTSTKRGNISARLVADMADWESCDETVFAVIDEDDMQSWQWADLSDSDF
ncbi:hypothetical protein Poli38472_010255 [Pythium oligandrum]|uniref:Uncharacterized protein n=1 Tax=Pythium oligandrum TaxID=41045 RepID=A0A8K1FDS9_PYTOL|nr:hypothetical protein Poli38472_010255 [Pythium oligandrum]|eukprot:TMW58696.1 hypothetical protein Poli38472_010255 [Pythium oligandrum]